MAIPYDFFQKVEQNLKYVIYGDTDSLYISIPQIKTDNKNEMYEKTKEISIEINDNIKGYLDKILLPKMGIDPIYNQTKFKTELVADAMVLIDVKKNYAYRMLVDEGKILDKPKVKFTNLAVTRSDIPKFTKEFISRIVSDILFSPNYNPLSVKKDITDLAIEMRTKLRNLLNNYEYETISTPKKWNTGYDNDPWQVLAMKLYNTLVNKDIFKPMSGGMILPLKVENYTDLQHKIDPIKNNSPFFINNDPVIKIERIAIPYNYEKETIDAIFKHYKINIDLEECWDKLYNKTARRIVEISGVI